MELVTSLPLSTALQRPSDHYFLPSSMVENQVLLCVGVRATPSPPKSLPSDGTSKLPASISEIPPGHISDLWGIWAFFAASHLGSAHASPQAGWKTEEEHSSVALCEDRQPALRQQADSRSERPDIMLMEAFGWFLHDFTPHCSSQLSDTVTGAEWEACNLNKAGENSQSDILIVVLPPHDPLGWFTARNTTC